jgi:hypothetical protein
MVGYPGTVEVSMKRTVNEPFVEGQMTRVRNSESENDLKNVILVSKYLEPHNDTEW